VLEAYRVDYGSADLEKRRRALHPNRDKLKRILQTQNAVVISWGKA